jgi:hypothetical protein
MTDIYNHIFDSYMSFKNNIFGVDPYLENILNIIRNIPFEEIIRSRYMILLIEMRNTLLSQNQHTNIEIEFMDAIPPPAPRLVRR